MSPPENGIAPEKASFANLKMFQNRDGITEKEKEIAARPNGTYCTQCAEMIAEALTIQSSSRVIEDRAAANTRNCPFCCLLAKSVLQRESRLGEFQARACYKSQHTLTIFLNPANRRTRLDYLSCSTLGLILGVTTCGNNFDEYEEEDQDNWVVEEQVLIFNLRGEAVLRDLSANPMTDPGAKILAMEGWMRTRIFEEHTLLQTPLNEIVLHPTHLLDIRDMQQPRLVDCRELPVLNTARGMDNASIPKYAAFSYCRSEPPCLRTTPNNLARMKGGVLLKLLPRSFQDAIRVANHLRIRFIWIDALCIVHDDPVLSDVELCHVGDIFRRATVTIAVHYSSPDDSGWLNDSLEKQTHLKYKYQPRADPSSMVPSRSCRVGICKQPNLKEELIEGDLLRQGLAVQQYVTSSRILHFTRHSIYLETQNSIWNDDGSSVDIGSILSDPESKEQSLVRVRYAFQEFFRPTHSISSQRLSSEKIPPEWLDLVEIYTHCKSNEPSQKLRNITGLVWYIRERVSINWAAGIWVDERSNFWLCKTLFWLPDAKASDRPQTPQAPQAPFWSWVSYESGIEYPLVVRSPRFQQRCSFVSLRDMSARAVSWLDGPGHLSIRGKLIQLREPRTGAEELLGPGPPRNKVPSVVSEGCIDLPRIELKQSVKVCHLHEGENERTVGWVAFDKHSDTTSHWNIVQNNRFAPNRSYSFLVLGTYAPKAVFYFHPSYYGVFLEKARDGNHYKRIGAGQIAHSYLLYPMQVSPGNATKLPRDFFAEENLETITLI